MRGAVGKLACQKASQSPHPIPMTRMPQKLNYVMILGEELGRILFRFFEIELNGDQDVDNCEGGLSGVPSFSAMSP
jgi:hypothetical protein